jgi:trehalose 6-phosphate phosphatase
MMARQRRNPPHFFRHWAHVALRLRESHRVVLFLDYDGTLVPIHRSPHKVYLHRDSQRVLMRLAKKPNVTTVVISGRRRAELHRLIGIQGIRYLGLYGSENGKMPELAFSARIALLRAYKAFRTEFGCYPGIWIENKVRCFCIHLREAQPDVRNGIRRIVRILMDPFLEELHLIENLHDIEVAPLMIGGKGIAVRRYLATPSFQDVLPMYIGNDLSDEPGFAAVGNGISILVGEPRRSDAQFLLSSPKEVIAALSRIDEVLT